MSPLRRIGLTGGIGSGKSTVAAMLADCGAVVVDADALARALTAPGGAAMPAVIQRFGAGVATADGALDREAMRARVFRDPNAKRALEAILHPMIGEATAAAATAAGDRPVVFDVPLLTESQGPRAWRYRVQRVLVVDCEVETQVARVVQRPGWTEAAARAVIDQQARREARRAIADAVLFNEGLTLDALRTQVQALWAHWQGAALPPA